MIAELGVEVKNQSSIAPEGGAEELRARESLTSLEDLAISAKAGTDILAAVEEGVDELSLD